VLTALVILLSVAAALLPPLVLERAVNRLTAGAGGAAGLALLAYLGAGGPLRDSGGRAERDDHRLRPEDHHGTAQPACAPSCGGCPPAYFTAHDSGAVTASRFVNDVDTVD
jgi:ATP-binding cassette subfamily B protein